MRVGLMTSSLPRKRSTTELLRLNTDAAEWLSTLCRFFSLLPPALCRFERKTGLEPATYSLEGYRSAK